MAERPGRQQPRSGKATCELLWVFWNLCMLLSLVCKGRRVRINNTEMC